LANCIVWGNHAPTPLVVVPGQTPDPSVVYCDIEGSWPGLGNLAVDPGFAEPGNWVDADNTAVPVDPGHRRALWLTGDYHLVSQVGRYDPSSDTWHQDMTHSECIDAGDPNVDWSLEPLPNGSRINMGVYGGTPDAGKSTLMQDEGI